MGGGRQAAERCPPAGCWGKPRASLGLNWVLEGSGCTGSGFQIVLFAPALPELPLHTFLWAPWTAAAQGGVWVLGVCWVRCARAVVEMACGGGGGGYQHHIDPLSWRASSDSPNYSTSNPVLTPLLKPAFNTSRWRLKRGRVG